MDSLCFFWFECGFDLIPVPDLEFGLPVQVRDHGLSIKDNLPQSDVNKEYFLQNVDNQVCVCVYTCMIHV